MGVLFVFVDGVGAGAADPAVNPLARVEHLLSRFEDGTGAPLPHGGRARLADACLGVPGRPQSATGQSTILTGENAPRHLGRHLLGFPNAPLRALLGERSLFRRLAAAGLRGAFLNAYPVAYLRALGLEAEGEPEFAFGRRMPRASATTVAYAAGGGRFRTWADARAGRALTHDVTGRRAAAFRASIPERTPEEAAAILAAVTAEHDLTVFEFFETDEAGHARDPDHALDALDRVDRLLRAVLERLGPDDALVVTSDHGNVEDLSIRNHTRAPVPVLGFGRAAGEVGGVTDLTDVAPLLLRLAGA
ncbi:MAG TPA: alkaline phosphatase family protein [Anaeromyxobacteraceae bacterium]|nr:alkaline phosphatase family protein [Anaeromyxobacteraceae bacterium]